MDVDRHKGVVGEPRVGPGDAGEFGRLARGELFVRVEAGVGGEQALAAENLVDAGKAAGKIVCGVEDGGVQVGEGGVAVEPGGVEAGVGAGARDVGEEPDGGVGAGAPLAEEAAVDVAGAAGEGEGREEVGEDVVVVAGEKGDIVAAGREHGADDVEGAVAVKGGDFDRDEFGDAGEGAPEGVAENAADDGGLQVEADEGKGARDGAAVIENFPLGIAGAGPRAEAEEAGVITQLARGAGFGEGLGCGQRGRR